LSILKFQRQKPGFAAGNEYIGKLQALGRVQSEKLHSLCLQVDPRDLGAHCFPGQFAGNAGCREGLKKLGPLGMDAEKDGNVLKPYLKRRVLVTQAVVLQGLVVQAAHEDLYLPGNGPGFFLGRGSLQEYHRPVALPEGYLRALSRPGKQPLGGRQNRWRQTVGLGEGRG